MRISDWSSDVCSSDLTVGHSPHGLDIVFDQHHGDSRFTYFLQYFGNLARLRFVQAGARLVRQQHPWPRSGGSRQFETPKIAHAERRGGGASQRSKAAQFTGTFGYRLRIARPASPEYRCNISIANLKSVA